MSGISKITFTIGLLFAALSLGAADKPSKNSKPPPAASPDKSVESLAESARKSVVTISHYGRDGKPDGVGAGFVASLINRKWEGQVQEAGAVGTSTE